MNRRNFLAASTSLTLSLSTPFMAFAGDRKGKFKGDNKHTVSGGVSIKNGKIVLAGNFNFDGAPDPRIALGKGGKFTSNTDFAVLKKDKGAQSYKIPANLKADDFDTVIIWCRKFSVQLAHAKIK